MAEQGLQKLISAFNETDKWVPNLLPIEDNEGYSYLSFDNCDRLRDLGAFNDTTFQTANFTLNMTAVKCLDHAPVLTQSSTIRAGVLTAMALISLFGNIATILSIHISRQRRISRHSWSAVYTLIIHLSVADLFVTVFCIAGEAAWSYTVAWLAGNVFCKLFKFLQMFSLYSSTFVLVLIGLDRFLAVRYPMKSLSTTQRCNRHLVAAWILSFVLSIPQLVVFRDATGPFLEEFHQCVTHGFYTEQWQEQLYTCLSLIFMFVLPLLVLICTYVCTITTIAQSEQVFRAEVLHGNSHSAPDLNRRRLIHRAKMKSLRISVVIVLAFIVCWTPYYTMMIIFMFLNPDKHVSDELQSGIFFFGMSNSLINPVIYGAFHLWPSKKSRTRSSRYCYDRNNSGNYRNSCGSTKINRMSQIGRPCAEKESLVRPEDVRLKQIDPKENHIAASRKSFKSIVIHKCSNGLSPQSTTKL